MYYDVNAEINHVKYLYNADGQRIYEITNGSLKGSLYDNGILISEYDNGGSVSAQYIHGLGLGHDVGSLICKQTAEDTQYSFYNYRGDVIDTLIGATITSYRYDAFGNLIDSSAPEFGFSSKRYDASTSLSYFGVRYYDASLGRFISRDPMGYIDGPNMYIYCTNNPINWFDPFGTRCERTLLATYEIGNVVTNVATNIVDSLRRFKPPKVETKEDRLKVIIKRSEQLTRLKEKRSERDSEQYSLRARTDGYYPDKLTGGKIYLKKNEVWKYGKSVNGIKRYTQIYYKTRNLKYEREYRGTETGTLIMEKYKLIRYLFKHKRYPPGNTKSN